MENYIVAHDIPAGGMTRDFEAECLVDWYARVAADGEDVLDAPRAVLGDDEVHLLVQGLVTAPTKHVD